MRTSLNLAAGIALLCREDGTIQRVLHDALGLVGTPGAGAFTALLAPGSVDKGRAFLAEITALEAALDWELEAISEGKAVALHFSGMRRRDGALAVIGALTNAAVVTLFQDMVLREDGLPPEEDAHYQALSRMNAALAATQRGLVRANAELTRVHAAAQQRMRELEALYRATVALQQTLELEPLLAQIVSNAVSAVTAAEHGLLLLLDDAGTRLHIRAMTGFADPAIKEITCPADQVFIARAMRASAPISIENTLADPAFLPAIDHPEIRALRSAVIAPLLIEGRVQGVLAITAASARAFAEPDVRVLEAFAATAAAAIHNAQHHQQMQRIAVTDALTGCANRRGFFAIGERDIEKARRFARPLTVLMCDIDFFKRVNDTYGHAVGDEILRAVALRMQRCLRAVDLVGRYGGEEFAVLLSETSLPHAKLVAERLRRKVAETPFETSAGPIAVTISLGVAWLDRDDLSLEALLRRADQALYAAKRAGRNRVRAARRRKE